MSEIAGILAWTASLFALDQWSKRLVQTYVADRSIAIGPALRLRKVIALKPASDHAAGRAALVLLWLFALLSTLLLLRSGLWFQSPLARVGVAAALGGAAGNLFDLLRRRAIVDFIDLTWWPTFNLADVAIIAGLMLAFSQR